MLRGALTELNLQRCEIGDQGAVIVATFLKHDECVRRLQFRRCAITPLGCKAIAEALKRNRTVWLLTLKVNPIGIEEKDALLNAFNYNVTVTDFNVLGCGLSVESRAMFKYLTEIRNETLIPDAVRSASLSLIVFRRIIVGAGDLFVFPKEIVKMIAMHVWATRKDPTWIIYSRVKCCK